jgi:hypothetical protein
LKSLAVLFVVTAPPFCCCCNSISRQTN